MKEAETPSPEMKEAEAISQKAREASRQCRLWLEHPWVAHDLHERAASAQEKVGHHITAQEHRKAAEFWAAKEAGWPIKRPNAKN